MAAVNFRTKIANRVTYYNRYRPSYPERLYQYLVEKLDLKPKHVIADVGAGTGLSSRWFAANGNTIYAIEPSPEMRQAAAYNYQYYPDYHIIAGAAEDTTLPDNSVDFIIGGQSFDWFDHEKASPELKRILKPDGYVLLFWNERQTESSGFLRQFEELLKRHAPAYMELNLVDQREKAVLQILQEGHYGYAEFDNCQIFNWEGLKGRLLSTSFIPDADQPEYHNLLSGLARDYKAHAVCGQVKVDYITKLYYGKPA